MPLNSRTHTVPGRSCRQKKRSRSQRRAAVRIKGGRLRFASVPTRNVFRQEAAQRAERFARDVVIAGLPVSSSNHGTVRSKTLTAVRVCWKSRGKPRRESASIQWPPLLLSEARCVRLLRHGRGNVPFKNPDSCQGFSPGSMMKPFNRSPPHPRRQSMNGTAMSASRRAEEQSAGREHAHKRRSGLPVSKPAHASAHLSTPRRLIVPVAGHRSTVNGRNETGFLFSGCFRSACRHSGRMGSIASSVKGRRVE